MKSIKIAALALLLHVPAAYALNECGLSATIAATASVTALGSFREAYNNAQQGESRKACVWATNGLITTVCAIVYSLVAHKDCSK